MYDKFKTLIQNDGFFYGVLIIIIAVASYGLGRMSVVETPVEAPESRVQVSQKAVLIESVKDPVPMPLKTVDSAVSTYVGSKNGTKYHLPTCPGAKQINEENKVFFATKEEAQSEGYSPAGNCKGI